MAFLLSLDLTPPPAAYKAFLDSLDRQFRSPPPALSDFSQSRGDGVRPLESVVEGQQTSLEGHQCTDTLERPSSSHIKRPEEACLINSMSQNIPSIIEDVAQQLRTNYMGFASFTLLVWDHIDTFADEVEYVWKGTKGPIVYLFLVNRYLTPLGFIVNLYAYLSPVWTPEL
ncbi:hypothetical protein CC2G_013133 [Coprinopsis cinerea AmutBmut pab1-1]|nr:hypothetical protein CC2G_013133 [Coprinopsis cinerea AmutBmut pab1-1]